MKHTYAAFLLALLLTACAPKVVVDMYTNEWPSTTPDSVRVYLMNDGVPRNTMAIGQVKVVDNGLSTHGTFERVVQMAIDATAENGGNGLIITEHRTPDGRSTIHRIWGTVLRIPETATTDSTKSESMRRLLLAEQQSERQNQEIKQYVRNMYTQSPSNIFRLNVGPSILCSKFQVGNHTYKSRIGFNIGADYEHVWKSGFGFGLNYLHNYTSFNEGVTTRLNYYGPSFLMATPLLNRWRYDLAVGIGYCRYSESFANITNAENCIGTTFRLGAEWKIAKHLALGAQLNLFTVSLKKPDNLELKKNEFYGIRHFNLLGGLRYYF